MTVVLLVLWWTTPFGFLLLEPSVDGSLHRWLVAFRTWWTKSGLWIPACDSGISRFARDQMRNLVLSSSAHHLSSL